MSAKLARGIRLFLSKLSGRRRPRRARLDLAAPRVLSKGDREAVKTFVAGAQAASGQTAARAKVGAWPLAAEFERACSAARAARIDGDANWRAFDLVDAAKALWRVAPQPRCARAVAGVLEYGRHASERIGAAAALAEMQTPEAELGLIEALDDGDPLVRHHAARALLIFYGIELDDNVINMMARCEAQPSREGPGAKLFRLVRSGGDRALNRI